jgi:hypothetical protein
VTPTEQFAKSASKPEAGASTPKIGLLATLGSLLHVKGTGAPSFCHATGTGAPFATSCKGTAAPSSGGGSGRSLHKKLALLALPIVLSMAGFVFASSASANTAWWHLTSGSRPSYIQPNVHKPGVNEVQEVTVEGAAGEKFLLAKLTPAEAAEIVKGSREFEKLVVVAVGAEAKVVQEGLEGSELYGAGNVEVGGGCTEAGGKFKCAYTVTFKSALASQPVEVINVEHALEEASGLGFAGTLTVTVVTPGARPTTDGELFVIAENLGNANIDGSASPVVLRDVLPPGLKAVGVGATGPAPFDAITERTPLPCTIESSGEVVSCKSTKVLPPFDLLEMRVGVEVQPGAKECSPGESSCERNEVSLSGGGAPEASLSRPVTINTTPTPFGLEDYALVNENEGGGPDTQAGSHPFQQTTSITLNQTADTAPLSIETVGHSEIGALPAGLPKDLHFKWPPGLIGNPTSVPRCTIAEFLKPSGEENEENECPADTAVGVAVVTVRETAIAGTLRIPVPLFNLEPAVGEPARFGFYAILSNSPVVIDTAVRSGSDYGVTVSSNNITQTAGFLSASVTVWGAPGSPSHDAQRGWGCLFAAREVKFGHSPCNPSVQQHSPPFLSLPTSCTGPSQSTVEGDPWSEPGVFRQLSSYTMPALDGCNRLPFSSEVRITPDGQQASTPTGLTSDVHVPQEEALNPAGLSPADVKDITVALPEGLILNPAAADGLTSCSEAQIGFTGENPQSGVDEFTPAEASCPDASKVGKVTITTPLLPNPLKGFVYLAAPQNFAGMPQENPFSSLVAMYIVARDPVSGVLVKLPGSVALNESTGQITATFKDTPQVPFEDAALEFFGGQRAPLATPAHCGPYTTNASFTPWSGGEPIASSSTFQITTGPNGAPCPPAALPFTAQLQAGSPNINAGGFSPLDTTISREDGNQNINQVTLHMAPGMSGILAGVPLCPEAQANAGTCGPSSLIGETIVSVGLGGDPFTVTGGKVYLTEKYQGAPFGLSIVNPADAGPFHLGKVIVRAKIEVDPTTAALTITTGEIPHIIKGFPLEIKHVNVTVNRPNFTFNPTNCAPQSITGTIGSVEGASSPVSVPFQVTNCATLKFTPKVSVTTAAHSSKANGASLLFKISYPKGAMGAQSWFNEAKFDLPKQLPARLTTIQKACVAATFEHNRGACPAASIIGHAVVHTPVLPVALEGPVYFVSYGGAAFPDAVLVLDGYGVHIELHGNTFINGKTSITSATFRNTPDVPFESIEVTIPSGKFGEFGANLPASAKGSFCGQKLVMPTLFKAQNGLEIHQNTAVGVTGCAKAKTRAQLYAAALKACHKDKNKAKRKSCESAARKKYGPLKKAKKK